MDDEAVCEHCGGGEPGDGLHRYDGQAGQAAGGGEGGDGGEGGLQQHQVLGYH